MNDFDPAGKPFPYPIKAIILDYGDVISLPVEPAVLSWMASVFQVPLEGFRQTYGRFRHDYDRGALQGTEYWEKICQANGIKLSPEQIAELRRADVAMWGRINEPGLKWAEELRLAGFKTAILSNMHHDMVEHLRANGAWTNRFDVIVFSSSVGMAKPEPEIFEYCLKALGVAASEALFIDDRDANIEAAIRLGMNGIVAPTTEAL
ncbi:MAG TPA: HAD family phosphatase, partial [Candidatus Angelobacter sp.]|nr:HAD family phosphatase [Candidatus Angelobacter sp.]